MSDKFTMNQPHRRRAKNNYDGGSVISNTYNDAAGAQKIANVGHALAPIQTGPTTWSCDLSSAQRVAKGVALALYNNDTAVHTITFGTSAAVTSLAAGVIATDRAGIALAPGQYTYVNSYIYDYAITDSNKVICYKVIDDTFMEARS